MRQACEGGEGCVVAPGGPTSCWTPDKETLLRGRSVNRVTISRNPYSLSCYHHGLCLTFLWDPRKCFHVPRKVQLLARFLYFIQFTPIYDETDCCCLVSFLVPNSLPCFQSVTSLFPMLALAVLSSDSFLRHVYPHGLSMFMYTEISSTM